jgi:hypothetical protein
MLALLELSVWWVMVVVEQYFGRMKTVFRITHVPYPYSLDSMLMDIQIVTWLTNQHVIAHALSEQDGQLYRQYINSQIAQHEEAKKKKAAANQKYRQTRQRLIEQSLDALHDLEPCP